MGVKQDDTMEIPIVMELAVKNVGRKFTDMPTKQVQQELGTGGQKMENLNAENIIKALECCTSESEFCTGCPFLECGACKQSSLLKLALSLIKELTEENEGLREDRERYRLLVKAMAKVSETQRNEVIDEFADMVKEKMREVATGKRTSLIGTGWIDEIARELKGE